MDETYGIERWGAGLVGINAAGAVTLHHPKRQAAVSLPEILQDLDKRGVTTPLLLRVAPWLDHAIDTLNQSFATAIEETGYQGGYRGVFPIKVNQQAHVVRRIVEYGAKWAFGLEAGSKSELVVALAQPLSDQALVICNGVKDREFIDLAIQSRKLGFNTVIVLESPKEAETVIECAQRLGLKPGIGVRIKLSHRIGGNWAESSGDRSTFGMQPHQLVEVIERLREADLLDCLILQHSHLGSQIPDIADVRRAATEACRYFTEMRRMGVPLTQLDLGGGLGVDYTGEKRARENSINYELDEYCTAVVESVRYAMEAAGEPHPILITESGRAITAHSSLLVFSALEATLYDAQEPPQTSAEDHHLLTDMAAIRAYLTPKRLQECMNDAVYYRDEMRALFRRGAVSLQDMARGERMFLWLMGQVKTRLPELEHSDEVEQALDGMADIYHCNFSLFQSLPDSWAIGQLHPVVPLQRLNEPPDRRAILADITCDSDGKLDRFILSHGVGQALPVHSLQDDQPYFFGVFFVGAYQETLGDLHNLFGDTNIVTIDLLESGGFELLEEVEGDSIAEVMSYVEYDPRDCLDAFRRMVDRAVAEGRIAPEDRRTFIEAYRASMQGYTYFE